MPTYSVESSIVGVLFTLVATCFSSIANIVMKVADNRSKNIPEHLRPPTYRRPIWWLVIGLLIGNASLDFAGFAFASLSVVAPISSLTIAVNAIAAHFVLGERITRRDAIGSAILISGSICAVIFGSREDPTTDVEGMKALFARPPFIVFTVIKVVLTILCFINVCGGRVRSAWRKMRDPPPPLTAAQLQQQHLQQPSQHHLRGSIDMDTLVAPGAVVTVPAAAAAAAAAAADAEGAVRSPPIHAFKAPTPTHGSADVDKAGGKADGSAASAAAAAPSSGAPAASSSTPGARAGVDAADPAALAAVRQQPSSVPSTAASTSDSALSERSGAGASLMKMGGGAGGASAGGVAPSRATTVAGGSSELGSSSASLDGSKTGLHSVSSKGGNGLVMAIELPPVRSFKAQHKGGGGGGLGAAGLLPGTAAAAADTPMSLSSSSAGSPHAPGGPGLAIAGLSPLVGLSALAAGNGNGGGGGGGGGSASVARGTHRSVPSTSTLSSASSQHPLLGAAGGGGSAAPSSYGPADTTRSTISVGFASSSGYSAAHGPGVSVTPLGPGPIAGLETEPRDARGDGLELPGSLNRSSFHDEGRLTGRATGRSSAAGGPLAIAGGGGAAHAAPDFSIAEESNDSSFQGSQLSAGSPPLLLSTAAVAGVAARRDSPPDVYALPTAEEERARRERQPLSPQLERERESQTQSHSHHHHQLRGGATASSAIAAPSVSVPPIGGSGVSSIMLSDKLDRLQAAGGGGGGGVPATDLVISSVSAHVPIGGGGHGALLVGGELAAGQSLPGQVVAPASPVHVKSGGGKHLNGDGGSPDGAPVSPDSVASSGGKTKTRRVTVRRMHAAPSQSNLQNIQLGMNVKSLRKVVALLSYAQLTAGVGSWTNMFGKAVVILIDASVHGDNQMTHFFTWVLILTVIACAGTQLKLMANMMATFDAVAIVPVFQCIFIINIIVSGSFYFDEFSSEYLDSVQFPLFLASIGLCFIGIFIVTGTQARPHEPHHPSRAGSMRLSAGGNTQARLQLQQSGVLRLPQAYASEGGAAAAGNGVAVAGSGPGSAASSPKHAGGADFETKTADPVASSSQPPHSNGLGSVDRQVLSDETIFATDAVASPLRSAALASRFGGAEVVIESKSADSTPQKQQPPAVVAVSS